MIFKDVRDGRPYPEHGLSMRDWARIPPRQIRMDELITTKRELRLDALLDEDSTFYGDLFGHAVLWEGQIYLEDGLHRALRAALQQRTVIHVRILNLDALRAGADADGAAARTSARCTRGAAGTPPLTRGCRQSAIRNARPSASSRPRSVSTARPCSQRGRLQQTVADRLVGDRAAGRAEQAPGRDRRPAASRSSTSSIRRAWSSSTSLACPGSGRRPSRRRRRPGA